jgi:hypothetical protein
MSVSVLTEGNFDGMLLAKLLANEQERDVIEVGVVNGLSSGFSFARTILAVQRTPVVVVIDADSPEPEVASERKLRAEEVLDDAAGGVPFRVIVAVPELDILFFKRPELLRRVFGKVDEHVIELAQLSPRRAIEKLSPGESYKTAWLRIFSAVDDADVKALREADLIQDLLRFVGSAVESSKHSAVSKV